LIYHDIISDLFAKGRVTFVKRPPHVYRHA